MFHDIFPVNQAHPSVPYRIFFYINSSIRLWALSGEVLLEMVGHTSIVYSVDAHASGLIVSGSEDRHAKIWKGNDGFPFNLKSCYLWLEVLFLLVAFVWYRWSMRSESGTPRL